MRRFLLPSLLCVASCAAPLIAMAQAEPPRIDTLPAPASSRAAPSTPAPAPAAIATLPAPATTGLRSEPAVQRNVVEDDNARIEELRVRGAVRSTVVKPKGAISAEYEVVPVDAGRDISEGPTSSRGTAGQRVWRVLTF